MAFGQATVSDIGGAVSDFFAADAYRFKAQGAKIEAEQYGLAAGMADLNAQYTEESTEIKEWQAQRKANLTEGQINEDVAANGFQMSGSGIDVLRDSVTNAALTKAVLGQQGLIEQKGYEEQAASFRLMQDAANVAANADQHAATGAMWSAGIKGAAAIATFFI